MDRLFTLLVFALFALPLVFATVPEPSRSSSSRAFSLPPAPVVSFYGCSSSRAKKALLPAQALVHRTRESLPSMERIKEVAKEALLPAQALAHRTVERLPSKERIKEVAKEALLPAQALAHRTVERLPSKERIKERLELAEVVHLPQCSYFRWERSNKDCRNPAEVVLGPAYGRVRSALRKVPTMKNVEDVIDLLYAKPITFETAFQTAYPVDTKFPLTSSPDETPFKNIYNVFKQYFPSCDALKPADPTVVKPHGSNKSFKKYLPWKGPSTSLEMIAGAELQNYLELTYDDKGRLYFRFPIAKNDWMRLYIEIEEPSTFCHILSAVDTAISEYLYRYQDGTEQPVLNIIHLEPLKGYLVRIIEIIYKSKKVNNPLGVKWHHLFEKHLVAMSMRTFAASDNHRSLGHHLEEVIEEVKDWIADAKLAHI